ncbi:MAG TPA: hypothetical protein VIO36_06885 [Anaerolineaceae bacterium]
MLTEDYLIRMINLAIAALLRLAKLRREGQIEPAQELIDITLQQLTGLRPHLIKQLEDERLYHILTRHERLDTQRLAIIAELFEMEGDLLAQQGRESDSLDSHARALRYYLEACFQDAQAGEDTSALRERIDALAGRLDLARLGADTLWPLAGYYEEQGAFTLAEEALRLLWGRADTRDAIQPELIAFYRRLLEKPAEEIARAGMDMDILRGRLAELHE